MTEFDQTKENLKMKIGREPSEKDVALEIIDNLGYHYFQNLDMELLRNTILYKGSIFKVSGDLRNALITYLELCYIDSNGPNNSGSMKNNPELLKAYPPFDPKRSTGFIPIPTIIDYIKQIGKDSNLSKEEIKQIFFEHNLKIEKFRKLPLSVQDSWARLEPNLIF